MAKKKPKIVEDLAKELSPKKPRARSTSAEARSKKATGKVTPAGEIIKKFEKAKKTSARKVKRRVTTKKTAAAAPKISKAASQTIPTPEQNTHITRPTLNEEAAIMERRWKIWNYYRTGASIYQISEMLKSQHVEGASVGQVHADLHYILNLQHTALTLSVEQHVENECAILNDVQLTYYPQMKNTGRNVIGDDKDAAAKIIITCVKERSKLRNLYKPTKIEIGLDEMLAELTGLKTEELPNEDEDDELSSEE